MKCNITLYRSVQLDLFGDYLCLDRPTYIEINYSSHYSGKAELFFYKGKKESLNPEVFIDIPGIIYSVINFVLLHVFI